MSPQNFSMAYSAAAHMANGALLHQGQMTLRISSTSGPTWMSQASAAAASAPPDDPEKAKACPSMYGSTWSCMKRQTPK